jgi:hypothetical protein
MIRAVISSNGLRNGSATIMQVMSKVRFQIGIGGELAFRDPWC